MPAGRFAPQGLGGPFPHMQQNHLSHHGNQHHPPGSAGLPPPSFNNSHPGFGHGNQASAMNAFTGANNVNGLASAFGGGALGGGVGLGSTEAMRSFAHGAQIQQQQSRDAMRRGSTGVKVQQKSRIRDVWQGNLVQEMQNLRELVDKYPYISMVGSHSLLVFIY